MPIVDIAETADEMIITVELPGLTEKDSTVRVDNGILTLAGERRRRRRKRTNRREVVLRGTLQNSRRLDDAGC